MRHQRAAKIAIVSLIVFVSALPAVKNIKAIIHADSTHNAEAIGSLVGGLVIPAILIMFVIKGFKGKKVEATTKAENK